MLSSLLIMLVACSSPEDTPEPESPVSEDILGSISLENMQDHVDILADDSMAGRIPGSPGHLAAKDYILSQMEAIGLIPIGEDGFEYRYPNEPQYDRYMLDETGAVLPQSTEIGYDLVGLVPGNDPALSDEYMVLMAHYDHLGVTEEGGSIQRGL